jgi:hypothetical protein
VSLHRGTQTKGDTDSTKHRLRQPDSQTTKLTARQPASRQASNLKPTRQTGSLRHRSNLRLPCALHSREPEPVPPLKRQAASMPAAGQGKFSTGLSLSSAKFGLQAKHLPGRPCPSQFETLSRPRPLPVLNSEPASAQQYSSAKQAAGQGPAPVPISESAFRPGPLPVSKDFKAGLSQTAK